MGVEYYMNSAQKEQVISMRKQKMTYAVISEKIGVSVGTIKSFCHRNGITVDKEPISSTAICKNCGNAITSSQKTKPRLFCCDNCKQEWWNKHRSIRQSNKMFPCTCEVCGNVFMDYISANRKYCSQACYQKRSETHG